MLYRHEDGTYTASSFDGECRRHMTKEEGEEIIKARVPEPERSLILSDTRSGFVLC